FCVSVRRASRPPLCPYTTLFRSHLTKTEYAVLKLLLQNSHQAVAKSVILDRIAADTPDCTEGSLKQHVSNLRKKLREAGGKEYVDRQSTRLNSSHVSISYAVFCL